MKLLELLKRHEGLMLKPYKDSVGILTIGYGRNLEAVGISKSEADVLLINDVQTAEAEAKRSFAWFDKLNDVRKDVVISMVFNLGLPRFLEFRKTISALATNDYDRAATEMMDSLWAKQVGGRAYELSEMMRTGEYIKKKEGNS